MAGLTRPRELRITVEDVTSDLVFDVDMQLLEPVERDGTAVRALATTADDRRAGRRRFEVVVDGWSFQVTAEPGQRARLRDLAVRAHSGDSATDAMIVRAQLAGRVVRVWVAPGDPVEPGQRLLAIEAMKMENEVRAPRAGTVKRVSAAVGVAVDPGDELVTIT
jgi:biotin carboxyl carrier protein